MSKFFLKLFIFSIPLLLYMSIPRFAKLIMDEDLEFKINTFLPANNEVNLIIAGESRAERQLIPDIFIDETGKNTVNIAKDVGDVISLVYANNKYDISDSNKTYIICVSSLLINDGSYKNWFMSQASITEIGFLNNILLFRNDYFENWYRRMGLIWDDLINNKRNQTLPKNDIRGLNRGYFPVEKSIEIEKLFEIDMNPVTTDHLWYRKPNNNGIRRKIFEKSILKFSETGAKVVLIQSPMAPTWIEISKNSYMHKMELEFGELLVEIDKKLDNVWAIDFYTNQSHIFTDDLFYNSTHLNSTGAELFTKAVIDSLYLRDVL